MAEGETIDLRGTRVLVVDDDEDSCEMLALVLTGTGATVACADTAAQALAAFEREPPHILISDIGLPDEDGFSLLRRVRGLPADRGAAVPAIALTGYREPEDRTRVPHGFQAHLTKPVELAVMLETVDRVLKTSRIR